jgi:hypothetical protein
MSTIETCEDPEVTLREKAERWIEDNEPVMALFERFAEDRRARGLHFGAKQLAERVRWETAQLFGSPKINNSFVAYIARELVRRDHRLADLMECRVTKAADKAYREPHFDSRVDPLADNDKETDR